LVDSEFRRRRSNAGDDAVTSADTAHRRETGTSGMRTCLIAPANDSGREPEVLTFSALLVLLGRRSRQSVYGPMRRDPSFPRPRQLGSEFSIGWLRGEVMQWLHTRPLVELNGLDAVERRRRRRKAER
jgi:predicted DNA-binding transcriptional regulator AlpA